VLVSICASSIVINVEIGDRQIIASASDQINAAIFRLDASYALSELLGLNFWKSEIKMHFRS